MENNNINRRQFLALSRSKKPPIRPPWSLAERSFQEACTCCGDCVAACPEHILTLASVNSFPELDFHQGACTFCKACVLACPSAALDASAILPWQRTIHIKKSCLPLQQVMCMTCAEQCDEQAISFPPLLGAVSRPKIELDKCTGCGACLSNCPSGSIEVY